MKMEIMIYFISNLFFFSDLFHSLNSNSKKYRQLQSTSYKLSNILQTTDPNCIIYHYFKSTTSLNTSLLQFVSKTDSSCNFQLKSDMKFFTNKDIVHRKNNTYYWCTGETDYAICKLSVTFSVFSYNITCFNDYKYQTEMSETQQCFLHAETNRYLFTYMGGSKIYSFNLDNNKFEIHDQLYTPEQIQIVKVITPNSFNDKNLKLYLVSKSLTKIYLHSINYPDTKSLNISIYNRTQELNFYNQVEATFIPYDNNIYIFTFSKGTTNFLSFFISLTTLNIGNNYQPISAYDGNKINYFAFMNNSPYYLLSYTDKSDLNKIKSGDLVNYQITIYSFTNDKIPVNDILLVGLTNKFVYFNGTNSNTTAEFCPFYQYSNNSACYLPNQCPDKTYALTDFYNNKIPVENRTCVSCNTGSTGFIYNNYCTINCPYFYGNNITTRMCDFCDNKYVPSLYKCVNTCPYKMVDQSYTCRECPSTKLYYNNQCVSICPTGTIQIDNSCELCKELGMFDNGNCVSSCPKGAVDSVCIDCPITSPFYQYDLKMCVAKCSDRTTVEIIGGNSTSVKICRSCNSTVNPYFNYVISVCEKECPKNLKKIEASKSCVSCQLDSILINDTCYTCNNDTPFLNLLNKTCVVNCPENTEINYINKTCTECKLPNCGKPTNCTGILVNNTCINCPSDSYYFYTNNSCVEKCPDYTEIDEIRRTCFKCETFDNSTYFHNNICKKSCDRLCKTKDINGQRCSYCHECQEKGQLKQNNDCVNDCSVGYYREQNDTCYSCASLGLYYSKGLCVSNCPNNYISKSENICKECDLKHNTYCVSNCPYLFGRIAGQCKKCSETNNTTNNTTFYYNESCYDKCPYGFVSDKEKLICRPENDFLSIRNCSGKGNYSLDTTSNLSKCICNENYSGLACEIYRPPIKNSSFDIVIESQSDDELIFGYKWNTQVTSSKPTYYKIKWIVTCKFPLNGDNQEKIKIKKQNLDTNNNTISLQLYDISNNKTYSNNLVLNIEKEDVDLKCIITYKEGKGWVSYGVSMQTFVTIEVSPKSQSVKPNNIYMKFFYLNEFEEKVSLTDYYSLSNIYASDRFPPTKKIIIYYKSGLYSSIQQLNCDITIEKNYNLNVTEHLDRVSSNESKYNIRELRFLSDILSNSNKKIENNKIFELKNFINDTFNKLMETNSKVDHTVVLSLYNNIIKTNDDINALDSMSKLLNDMTRRINRKETTEKKTQELTDLEIHSYYHTFDNVYTILNKRDTTSDSLQKLNENNSSVGLISKSIKSSLNNMNRYVSSQLVTNEHLVINTQYFSANIFRLSSTLNSIKIDVRRNPSNQNNTNQILLRKTNYIHNIVRNTQSTQGNQNYENDYDNTDKCKDEPGICINQDSLSTMNLFTKYYNHSNINQVSAILTETSSRFLSKSHGEYLSPLSSFELYDIDKSERHKDSDKISYRAVMDFTESESEFNKFSSRALIASNSSKFDLDKLLNASCININDVNNPTCTTYFNYDKKKVICKCKGLSEVTCIFNSTLAKWSKVFQFPVFEIDMINPLSMSIIVGSFTIVILFTIILNIFDIRDDGKFLKSNSLNDHTIFKTEFNDVILLKNSNFFNFAFYITLYAYPFFGVFNLYRYDHPRYLRFWIEMLYILLNLTFSLLPYYKIPFSYGKQFIDERDIEYEALTWNNLPLRLKDLIYNEIYGITASILIIILMNIFLALVQWENFINKVWKHRKKLIEKYIRFYIIKPLIIPNYWLTLRMRLIAYYRICGNVILNKRNKKFLDTDENDLSESLDYMLKKKLLTKDSKKIVQKEIEMIEIDTISHSIVDEKNELFINRRDNFGLNLLPDGNLRKKTLKLKNKTTNSCSLPSLLKINPNVKKFSNNILRRVEVVKLEILKIKHNKLNDSSYNKDVKKLTKSLIIFLAILCFYLVLYVMIFYMLHDIYKTFSFNIIKIWLIPSMINLVIINFIINFLTNIIFSWLCFNRFDKRKSESCLYKLIFKYLISEYVIDMYIIRNFVTKYYKKIDK